MILSHESPQIPKKKKTYFASDKLSITSYKFDKQWKINHFARHVINT